MIKGIGAVLFGIVMIVLQDLWIELAISSQESFGISDSDNWRIFIRVMYNLVGCIFIILGVLTLLGVIKFK